MTLTDLERKVIETMRAELEESDLLAALRLIAAPQRPDGTWNRDREACRQLAQRALDKWNAE